MAALYHIFLHAVRPPTHKISKAKSGMNGAFFYIAMSETTNVNYIECKKRRLSARLRCWHDACYMAPDMKLIIAYIQPERLNAVKQSLCTREIYKMSVTNALGCGQQGGYIHMYRGATEEVSLHKKMRIAIGVNDDYVEKTIEAIIEGARTGDIGDGKIFVLPMEECVRIRTGERGPNGIG